MSIDKVNRTMNGKWGRIWVNDELWAECESFEAKVTGNYEEQSFCEDMSKHQKLMGWSGSGTMTLKKMYSRLPNLLGSMWKTGNMPDIKIIARIKNPSTGKQERVEIIEVTFDEMTLSKFADNELLKEEIPFKFADYNYIDTL